MFRRFFTAVAVTLLATPTWAQVCGTTDNIASLNAEERARLTALVEQHAYAEGNLWRAEKPGSTVTVVGTLHIPDPRLAPLVEQVAPYLEAADLLILEATSEHESGMQAMAFQQPDLFFITEGPTLIDLLGEEDWAVARERFEQLGVPGIMAAKFQPWYATLTLSLPPCALRTIRSGERGFDRQLEAQAVQQGTPIATLDDPEALMAIFTKGSQEEQLDFLRLSLETSHDSASATSTLIIAYFEGRVREAWEYTRILIDQLDIEGGAEMFDEMDRLVLRDRNVAWEPKISELVDGKIAVLAVGAAHLSGESGVLRALERAGYVVSPL